MKTLHALLTYEGRFPCRRTWERRLARVPDTLPGQIAAIGCFLVEVLAPFAALGRAVALDFSLLRASGGRVWHKKHRLEGVVPYSGLDTQAGWTKSGHHGWVYGWKFHLAVSRGDIQIPLVAELTPANCADSEVAPRFVEELPLQVQLVLDDTHYNTPDV